MASNPEALGHGRGIARAVATPVERRDTVVDDVGERVRSPRPPRGRGGKLGKIALVGTLVAGGIGGAIAFLGSGGDTDPSAKPTPTTISDAPDATSGETVTTAPSASDVETAPDASLLVDTPEAGLSETGFAIAPVSMDVNPFSDPEGFIVAFEHNFDYSLNQATLGDTEAALAWMSYTLGGDVSKDSELRWYRDIIEKPELNYAKRLFGSYLDFGPDISNGGLTLKASFRQLFQEDPSRGLGSEPSSYDYQDVTIRLNSSGEIIGTEIDANADAL